MPLYRDDGVTEIPTDKIPVLPAAPSGKFMRDDGTWAEVVGGSMPTDVDGGLANSTYGGGWDLDGGGA